MKARRKLYDEQVHNWYSRNNNDDDSQKLEMHGISINPSFMRHSNIQEIQIPQLQDASVQSSVDLFDGQKLCVSPDASPRLSSYVSTVLAPTVDSSLLKSDALPLMQQS